MKTIRLKIKKEVCKDRCPIPLNLIPNMEKGIVRIDYDKKTEMAKLIYNENLINKRQIIKNWKKLVIRC